MCSQIHQAARAKNQDKHESLGLTGENHGGSSTNRDVVDTLLTTPIFSSPWAYS